MDQSLDSPISHNHLLRALVVTRLVAARRLAPGRHRIPAAGSLSFATTVRVVHRIHRHTTNMRPNPAPAGASGFSQRNVFMFDIAYLAHSRATLDWHSPNLAGRHAQLCVRPFLGQQLRKRSGGARHLPPFARTQFDIVNLRAERNVPNRQSVARKNVGVFAAGNYLANFQSDRRDDVALLTIDVGHERDIRRSIRIILDLSYASGEAVFVALEIDDAIEPLMTATTPTNRDPAVIVTTRNPLLRFEQRFFRYRAYGQLIARQVSLVAPRRRCRC